MRASCVRRGARLCHACDLGDVRVGGDVEQIVVTAQPPQQAIEQGEPFGGTVQDRGLRQFDELR
jgi:hypothetical protein